METMELKARIRKETGKGPGRKLRANGQVPAVFYGAGIESLSLAVNTADLITLLKGKKENAFIKLLIDDEGRTTEKLSIMKELQTRPATRELFHADFYEIRMDHQLVMDIPIRVTGTPVGVTMGGELHILKRELKVSGLPMAIPESVEVDVSGLNIGDSVQVRDIKISEGVEVVDHGDVAVAAVSATKMQVAAAAEGEEAKEPEVITAKTKEKE